MDLPDPAPGTATDPGRPLPPPRMRPWRLVRARRDILAGVCGGLAGAAGVDVTLVRLAFVVTGLSGIGILAYIVLALAVPREDPASGRPLTAAPTDTARWIRIALLVVPILSLTGVLGRVWRGPWSFPFPLFPWRGPSGVGLLLVVIGVTVIWLRRRSQAELGPPVAIAASGPPSEGPDAPLPAPDASWRSAQSEISPRYALRGSTGLLAARVFAWLAVFVGLVAGATTIWLERIGALSIPKPVLVVSSGVLAVGVVAVAAILARTAGPVLASVATLLIPVALVVSFGAWQGGVGNRFLVASAVDPNAQPYRLAIGRLTLDLTNLPVGPEPVAVSATDKIGQLEVLVSSDVAVTVDAHVGAGQSRIFGRQRSGLNVTDHASDAPPVPSGTLHLDLDVGVGQLTVCRSASAGGLPPAGCAGLADRATSQKSSVKG